MVRGECLDLILVWPGEVLNTLGSRNVSSRVQILLTNAEHCSPFETWGNYIERLAVYRSHIMAIRDCVAEPLTGGGAEAGEGQLGKPTDLDNLAPATKKAWASWKLAESKHPGSLADRQAFDWLAEQPDETFIGDLVGYELPAFDTWQRYVREARNALGENKNLPRAGRAAGAVVRADEI